MSTPVSEAQEIIHAFRQGRLSAQLALQKLQQMKTRMAPRIPLSEGQRGLWIAYQLNPNASAYNVPWCFRLRGALDTTALQSACRLVLAKYPILASVIEEEEGIPYHVCQPADVVSLGIEDICASSPDEILSYIGAAAKKPFVLEREPPVRFLVFRTAADEHVLLLNLHHVVIDGRSAPLLLSTLFGAYGRAMRAEPLKAEPMTAGYQDFIGWERAYLAGEHGDRDRMYWSRQLAGSLPSLRLPVDGRRPNGATGLEGSTLSRALPVDLCRQLKQLAAAQRVNASVLFLALYKVLLHRYSGETDIIVGMPTMRRPHERFDQLIGYFINLLPLRSALDPQGSFADLLRSVQLTLADALDHGFYPYSRMLRELQITRAPAHAPVFQVAFGYQNARLMTLPGVLQDLSSEYPFEPVEGIHQEGEYELLLEVLEQGDSFVLNIKYDTASYEHQTIVRMMGHLQSLMCAVATDPGQPVDTLPLLTGAERGQLLTQWSGSAASFGTQTCIHELFEAQVRQTPDAIAVVAQGAQITYRNLNVAANRLARHLRRNGVTPDSPVAACVGRGLNMVLGWLAVLKAGGAFVPLDPAYPFERLLYMLQDSSPIVLLLDGNWHAAKRLALPPRTLLINLDADRDYWSDAAESDVPRSDLTLTPEHLAYIIYTSGSTGAPKGVMVEHRQICNLLRAILTHYRMSPDDRMLQFVSPSFDVAVQEVFAALLCGASLVLRTDDWVMQPEAFWNRCEAHQITVAHLPAAFWRQLTSDPQCRPPSGLRLLVIGGEPVDAQALSAWFRAGERRPELLNEYGPTETTVTATSHVIRSFTENPCCIGSALANVRVYVLDARLAPVPIGVSGELYVGGAGVARGYCNRPDLTVARFLADPFAGTNGARMYKTGDLARWRADGTLEFLGRNDEQVKIRGFRIEPGEIEAQLERHAQVSQAAVIAREDVPGDKRLVAYFTQAGDVVVSGEELRRQLQAALPEYMVPAAFVRMESLPLTPNGKFDRRALPAPDPSACSSRQYVAPQGPIEQALARVWQDLLRVERVGREDNFFQLGGHSLLIVRMIEQLRCRNVRVEARNVFAAPSLASLAMLSAPGGSDAGPGFVVPAKSVPPGSTAIAPQMLPLVSLQQEQIDRIVAETAGGAANIEDIYPLAPLQQGILFHHLMSEEGDPYLLNFTLSFDRRERLDRYLAAWQSVIDRHDILRTRFHWEGLAEPVQVVLRKAQMVIEEVELINSTSGAPAGGGVGGFDPVSQLRARCDPRHYRLDVRQAPLVRAVVAQDHTRNRHLLSLFKHHLICDNTTVDHILKEVQTILHGQSATLAQPLPFRNFVAYAQNAVSTEEHESFFREMLHAVHEPTAPFGLMDVQGDGANILEACTVLELDLARRLRMCAGRAGVSVASLMHVGWARVVARTVGRGDVVFGTVLMGRMYAGPGADRTLGLFLNTLPVRIRTATGTVEQQVEATHGLLAQLLRHEQAPLTLAQRCSGVPSPTPLFSSLLNFRYRGGGSSTAALQEQAWAGIELLHVEGRTNYPITLNVDDLDDGFSLTAQVSHSLDPKRICDYMATALMQLVHALEQVPEMPLRHIDVLPEAERRQTLFDWNRMGTASRECCIQDLFEEQVRATPAAVALRYAGSSVPYAELDRRSNQLAWRLMDSGVGPETVVGLCLPPSIPRVVAMLGILKAGGACLPLEPGHPAERVVRMLEDARAAMLVTEESLLVRFTNCATPVVCLDRDSLQISGQREDPPLATRSPRHLAFVIYTSASSGRPKPVALEHRAVVSRLEAQRRILPLDADDVCIHKTSIGFVDSIVEMLHPLITGCPLVIAPQSMANDALALIALIERMQVTRLLTVPSFAQAIVELPLAAHSLSRLRSWTLSGEALSADLLSRLHQRLPRCRFLNLYGSTEVAADATCFESQAIPTDGVPIGRPLVNTQVYVLDSELEPVPHGAVGEIHVGGACLARGYLHHPSLTAERFIANPHGAPGSRLLRTGDLGRYSSNGELQYLGRADQQVKIRGYRIEPSEVEAVLLEHAGVKRAVAVARETAAGEKRLVGYVVAEGTAIDVAQLREYLKEKLPRYMVPASLVVLEELPLTGSGKIDRKALPMPEGAEHRDTPFTPPGTATEIAVAQIWAQILQGAPIGIDDDFFEIGGHSLLGTRVMSQVSEVFDIELPLRILFDLPTIRQLGARIDAARSSVTPAVSMPVLAPQSRSGSAPLSTAQERVWSLDQSGNAWAVRNLVAVLRLDGRLDAAALRYAWDTMIERHEVLRTRIEVGQGVVAQIATAACASVQTLAASNAEEFTSTSDLARLIVEQFYRKTDVRDGMPLRGTLLKLRDHQHVLLVALHPIVADDWSINVILRELSTLYGACLRGEPDPLPPLPLQYADFAIWERTCMRGSVLAKQLAHWVERLRGLEGLELLPEGQTAAVTERQETVFPLELTRALSARLRRLAVAEGVTPYMLLLSAFKALLHQYCEREDIVIGTRVTGRAQWQTRVLIGTFANTLLLRTVVQPTLSFRELLARVKETTLTAGAHQGLPVVSVLDELPQSGGSRRRLGPQVEFIWGSVSHTFEMEGLTFALEDIRGGAHFADLTLQVTEAPDNSFAARIRYAADVFDTESAGQFADLYLAVLQQVVVNPDIRLHWLMGKPAKERPRRA